jgi:hypothetical protein
MDGSISVERLIDGYGLVRNLNYYFMRMTGGGGGGARLGPWRGESYQPRIKIFMSGREQHVRVSLEFWACFL